VIRPSIVFGVVRRELLEIVRNRTLLAVIVIPPVLVIALPIIFAASRESKGLPDQIVANLIAARPDWAGLTPRQLANAFGLQQSMFIFLVMPASVPLAIASYSIVGEKQTRSLEAVIATPISTEELLAGKTIAAIIPALLTVWLAYVVLIGVVVVAMGAALTRVIIDPTWFATVFALGPAIGLVSVVIGIAVSSRVNDPRAVQQVGTVILLPIILLMVVQLQSGQLLATKDYLLAAAGVAVVAVIGLRLTARLFGRETILTRWR
jgi:ABC-type Na+ efflux pump permease subunit